MDIRRLKLNKNNKKAQVMSIIYFFAVVVGIFILGMFLLKLINVPLTKFAGAIGNVSSTAGKTASDYKTKIVNLWDYVLLALFMLNVILLFVSAFLVDIHPAFLFIYIIAVFLLIVLGSPILTALQEIWKTGGQFEEERVAMPITEFIINNFTIVLLAVIILSGIVMYAKIRFGGGGSSAGY